MNKRERLIAILLILLIPVIVYFYFLKWKTGTMYGDDLYMFKDHAQLKTFYEKINMPVSFGKYRPVHGVNLHLLIELFQKNIEAYYLFNITIQVVNSILFAAIINIFLKSPLISLCFGLIVGLSRFAFFNIAQLLNGGALEGIAMMFFLACLLFIVIASVRDELSSSQRKKALAWSILFANLSMYTHERYIMLLPFIIFLVFLFPGFKNISLKSKTYLFLFAAGSIALNVFLKKQVYGLPFFVGTAGTNIELSIPTAFSFFSEAVLSIFQINVGPEYLVGIKFTDLPFLTRLLVVVLLSGLGLILGFYLYQARKSFSVEKTNTKYHLPFFGFLIVLFGLFLIPAVITIRLEQRWLQASFSVFILLIAIILGTLNYKNSKTKSLVFFSIPVLFLWTDFTYLNKGGRNIYMTYSEDLASVFHEAVNKNTIKATTKKVYVWEKQKDANTENTIKWDLAEGYFFQFYQKNPKKIIFVDSIYQKAYSFALSSFINFDKTSEQIIYIKNDTIIDITNDYLTDSLKNFISNLDNTQEPASKYKGKELMITNDDFASFSTSGFYDNENGIRWTNGNAAINLEGDYTIKDSLNIELSTYMPPVCKDIVPDIILTDSKEKNYKALVKVRDKDKFIFNFYFDTLTTIRRINILSAKIEVSSSDKRELSFPFISLQLK